MRAAFISFMESESARLIRFLMYNGASLEDSKDAVQDAFLDTWKLLITQPAAWITIEDPRLWIRQVARRALARPRGQRRTQAPTVPLTTGLPGHDRAVEDEIEQAVVTSDLCAALRRVPPDQRLAMAYYLEDLTHPVIAEQLGITEQQSRDLIKRARTALRVALLAYHGKSGDPR
ncbi:RNA polymerase sigma factor [Nonomuraea soli]|uniref:RNA polymerase sigma factor (Sigma-70 family) n=1 Tax=Nonomuraea soli TaxID=1032476 RepID=A0A7W0HNR2_9ACTN|nr:sigma-70 family RNA polymerase sigma factor [Nonomuraea soli]MBA2890063.1 RNA polymerase sigma factor (sigma-70 family) [Nonomuraea soli]